MAKKASTPRIMDLERGVAGSPGQIYAAVTASGPAVSASPPPTDLSVTANVLALSAQTPMARISLQWRKPLQAQEVRQYQVQVATDSGFTTGIIYHQASDTSISIDVVTNTSGIAYWFRVRVLSGGIVSAWSNSVTATSAIDATPAGQPTGLGWEWSGADLILTWTNPGSSNMKDIEVRIWESASKVTLLHTGYSSTGRYPWTLPQQRIDTGGSLDAAVYFELRSRTYSNVIGTTTIPGTQPTNAVPSAPSSVSLISSIGTLTISVTATPPTDFQAYRYRIIQTLPSASDVVFDSPSPLENYSLYSQATYQVGVKILDVYGQLSSETLSSTSVIDTLTIGSLRANVIYSDADGNSDATLHVKLSDGVLTSGGQTYSTTGTWNKWVRAERPNLDRYRTVTLSMTPASGTSTWYLRLSNDGSTWSYYAGPVTSSRILTLVADAAAAQAAAVSAGTLGGQTTSRVELPSNVEARFVEVWMRNAGPANTRLDEFYPRRVVEADDIKVQNLSGISADLGTMTAGTITGATIQTAASGARIELTSANGLRSYDASNVLQAQIRTSDGQMYFANGDVRLGSFGMRLIVPTSAYQYSSAYQFYETSGSTVNAALQSYKSAFANELNLVANAYNTCQSDITIESKSGSSSAATASLSASGNSGTSIASVVLTGASSGTTSTVDVAGELRVNYSINGSGSPYIRNTNAGSSAYGTLYIGNNTDVTSGIIRNSSANAGYAGANSLSLIHVGAYPIGFVTSNTLRMTIGSGGEVAIGRAPVAGVRLIVQGSGTSSATYGFNVKNSAGTDILSTRDDGLSNIISSAWSSDARHKEHIRSIDDSDLARFRQLEPRHYIRTNGPGGPEYGLIAQHTQRIFPELIFTDQEGFLSIRYTDTIPLLMAEVQLLRARLDVLEAA